MLIVFAGITACEREDGIPAISKAEVMMVPIADTLPPVIAENTLLTNTHTWYIKDWVYVTNEATLTIEPGTVIQMINKKETGSGLVITRGAKINATGLYNWPVLFMLKDADTTHTRGGWSGIVLLGRAPKGKAIAAGKNVPDIRNSSGWAYGGELPEDSSGALQHVRIVTMSSGNAVPQGLLLLGVGRKTVIDDVVMDTLPDSPYRIEGLQLK
jgi:hypothetical protein